MTHTLLALHGFTMNAEIMRQALEPIVHALEPKLRTICLNAPHVCSPENIARMYAGREREESAGPHLRWWEASDDGLEYRGLDATLEVVREALERYEPASILGFSQGGILAAAIAALSQHGELPHIHSAVLIAGRTPRAARLQAALIDPIAVPSLHVWGDADTITGKYCEELVQHFAEKDRAVCRWPAGHVIPTRGPAFDAIVRFVLEHA
ncbi:MAG TPA: hypothetical protein VHV51_17555 [Polyangiaceae bacterium]|jgi:predicted esterase|nr:hypothetical protein [Polyangiaceae bacterium]